jgi:hypothetical protein
MLAKGSAYATYVRCLCGATGGLHMRALSSAANGGAVHVAAAGNASKRPMQHRPTDPPGLRKTNSVQVTICTCTVMPACTQCMVNGHAWDEQSRRNGGSAWGRKRLVGTQWTQGPGQGLSRKQPQSAIQYLIRSVHRRTENTCIYLNA